MATVVLIGDLSLAACGVEGLNFVRDDRVQITAPEERSQVRLPVTVEWEVEDFEVAGPGQDAEDAGFFGVFVDRAPQPPGEPLEWHARDDDGCVAARGCPDEEWFERRRIFVTTESSLVIEALARGEDDRRELHEVTIVLLDGQGRRIGESAWDVEFEVVRSR